MREFFANILSISGAILVSYGAWLAHPSLGFIVPGVLIIVVSFKI